jgi:hypothetical protein
MCVQGQAAGGSARTVVCVCSSPASHPSRAVPLSPHGVQRPAAGAQWGRFPWRAAECAHAAAARFVRRVDTVYVACEQTRIQ